MWLIQGQCRARLDDQLEAIGEVDGEVGAQVAAGDP